MAMFEVVNIVGITAYVLMAVFFGWLAKIPGSNSRIQYWLIAIFFMLIARLALQFLPTYLPKDITQAVYSFSLMLEKLFLISGLIHFVDNTKAKQRVRKLINFTFISIVALLLIFLLFDNKLIFLSSFSTIQAVYLLIASVLIMKNRQKWYLQKSKPLALLLTVYAFHWMTYPIAINYPSWLSLGYLVGNTFNITLYLSLAYLVVYRFQFRMMRAEQSALVLAEKAKQSSLAKSEFLANMSHEIRTPMNGILGMLELLTQDQLTTEQKYRVEIALNSGKGLLSIINDILDFSKIEAGKLNIDATDFDLNVLLEEVIEIMKNAAQQKNISLMLDNSQIGKGIYNADSMRIKQVLLNLTSNAIKFTEQGEVVITAQIEEKQGKTHLICIVKDSGIGIDSLQINNVFSSFEQEDNSTTRKFGGTGLGLSISKQLCLLMSGDISVKSEKGCGSCFTVDIPLAKSINDVKQYSALTPLNILLIESNGKQAAILNNILVSWKMSVTTHTSVDESLSLFNDKTTIDLVIVAQTALLGSTENINKQCDALSKYGERKLIIVSDETNREPYPSSIAGKDDYRTLNKPVLPSALFNCIQKMFPQSKPTVESEESGDLHIPQWLDNTRILLIEDNRINQIVASQTLMHFNLSCDIANHGAEGLEMLKQHSTSNKPYNLILMDCQMPVLDGYLTTEKIRQGVCGEEYQQINIIAMTANAMAGDKEKCLAAGMDDYLTKPLQKDVMLETLSKWLVCK